MRKPGVLKVSVPNKHKTSLAEAGIYKVRMKPGERLVVIGMSYFPDHDWGFFKAIEKFLRQVRPERLVFAGSIIHDDPFQLMAVERGRQLSIHEHEWAPEVVAAYREGDCFENRVLALGRKCGEWLVRLCEIGGSRGDYIPSTGPLNPNEAEIVTFLDETKGKRDAYFASHPREGEVGPPIPRKYEEFPKLLGLENHPFVTVRPFGSGLLLNDKSLILVGSQRRKWPLTAAMQEANRVGFENVIRTFDGKVADIWYTQLEHTLPAPKLRYMQAHEVGMSYCMERLGYLGDNELRGPSILIGTMLDQSGSLCVQNYPFMRGDNNCRSFVYEGEEFGEDEPGGWSFQDGEPRPPKGPPPAKEAATEKSAPKAGAPAREQPKPTASGKKRSGPEAKSGKTKG